MCKNLVEERHDLDSLADDIFEKALNYLNDRMGADQGDEELRNFVEQFRSTFKCDFVTLTLTYLNFSQPLPDHRNHMSKFDPDGVFKTNAAVKSNDFYYIQSASCLMRCRCFLHSFITKWNAKPSHPNIHHTKSSMFARKDASSGNLLLPNLLSLTSLSSMTSSVAPLLSPSREDVSRLTPDAAMMVESKADTNSLHDGPTTSHRPGSPTTPDSHLKKSALLELPLLPNPLQKDLHFDLPISECRYEYNYHSNHRRLDPSTLIVRDLLDAKGSTQGPDVGSVIAYALASSEYEEKKYGHANGTSKNPTASSEMELEQLCEVSFSDSRSQYQVKVSVPVCASLRSILKFKVYFPESFEYLRGIIFGEGEEQFMRSLSRTTTW